MGGESGSGWLEPKGLGRRASHPRRKLPSNVHALASVVWSDLGLKYLLRVEPVSQHLQVVSFARGQRWIAFICLFLMLAAAVSEASHAHFKSAATDSPIRCSLCVAAHSAKPAPICQPLRSVRMLAVLPTTQNPVKGSHLATSDLFVRPPPSTS